MTSAAIPTAAPATPTSAGCSSIPSRRRSAAKATECASTVSVLRPLPVAKTRTCAESSAGTSMTSSPVVDQAVGEVAADAVAALDCPDPIGESFCSGEHLLISGGVGVGGVSAGGQDVTGGVDGFDGGRAFVWIHSDDDGHRCGLPWSADLWCPCREGIASSSVGQSPFEPLRHGTRWEASQLVSHTNLDGGQPLRERSRRAPGADPGRDQALAPGLSSR